MALGVATTNGVGLPLVFFPARCTARCSTKGSSTFAPPSSYLVSASPSTSGAIQCCIPSSSLGSGVARGLSRLAGWFGGFGKVSTTRGHNSRITICPRKGQSLSFLLHDMHQRGFKVYAGDQPQPPPKPPIHEPLVGHIAPDFEAEAVFEQEFVKIKLSSYFGKKFVVLFFYPLDFTFVCPTEITQFSDRYDEFQKLNTEVIAVSTDSVFSHLAWVQTDRKAGGLGDLKYPIASDLTKVISRRYGVLIVDQGVALRGLFIIDKQGVIQHATINNLSFGRSVDETLRTLHAVQHVQQHPEEGCPAGWQPGDKPLKQGKDYLK